MKGRPTRVEAYSGYAANERPLSFLLGGKKLAVRRILRRGRTPGFDTFRVEAEDGNIYGLAWDRCSDRWLLLDGDA
jgi:hypothetical protein